MLRVISGATVVGFSRSSFQTGNDTVYGYNVNFTYPLSSEGSKGSAVGSIWMSKKFFEDNYIEVGNVLQVARVRSGDRYKFELVI